MQRIQQPRSLAAAGSRPRRRAQRDRSRRTRFPAGRSGHPRLRGRERRRGGPRDRVPPLPARSDLRRAGRDPRSGEGPLRAPRCRGRSRQRSDSGRLPLRRHLRAPARAGGALVRGSRGALPAPEPDRPRGRQPRLQGRGRDVRRGVGYLLCAERHGTDGGILDAPSEPFLCIATS